MSPADRDDLENAPTLVGDESSAGVAREPGSGPHIQPGHTIAHYVLLEHLGSGGMGVVYAARDTKLDRRVALKLLAPEISSHDIRGRLLLSEAKAMARLSHPNVCTVFEIGEVDDRLFVAMEYVDGTTLGRWLADDTRSWRDIVEVMAAAGRGLAAAHRAGLVHRDFKPENVMIDREGRVRVMDFGLAGELGAAASPARAGLAGNADDELGNSQTLIGNLVGTPSYMAPEQLRMQTVDERCDQFAFSVTLFQALYGQRPYPGKTLHELLDSLARGAVREPPARCRVPGRIHKILLRGLAIDPDGRYPGMDALVAELVRVPRRRKRLLAAAAAVMLLAGGSGLGVSWQRGATPASTPCASAAERMQPVWNRARKSAIESAFRATGVPYAALQEQRTLAILDRYAARWVAMHTDACEATRVRGEQSDAMLDRRMICLDGRRQELDALVGILGQADAEVVQHATRAALGLGELEQCTARESLLAAPDAPADPVMRDRVDSVRVRLAEIEARLRSGKYKDARASAESVVEDARATGYAPVAAEALFLAGVLRGRTGDRHGSERALLDAALAAEVVHDDRLRARALSELVYYVGYEKGDSAAGEQWARQAEAALARSGGDRKLEAQLWRNKALMAYNAGDYQASYDHHERGLELGRQVLDADHPDLIESLTGLGGAALLLRHGDEAIEHLELARDLAERSLGQEHPVVADALNNLGNAYASRGQLDEARRYLTRARDIWAAALGEDHASVAIALSSLGYLAVIEEEYEQAVALYERALAIEEAALGKDHVHIGITLSNLGAAYLSKGEPGRAVALLERADGILGGAASADSAHARFALARALWATGKRDAARERARSARDMLANLGERHAGELDDMDDWLAEPE